MPLQKLPEISGTRLGGVSEFDENFVLDCYKGKKLNGFSPRCPRKHGAKAEKRAFLMNMYVSVPKSSGTLKTLSGG